MVIVLCITATIFYTFVHLEYWYTYIVGVYTVTGTCGLPVFKCVVTSSIVFQDKYVLKLVGAMEKIFEKQYAVSTALVADYHQYVYKSTGQ